MLSGDDLTVQTFIAATAIALLGIAVTQAGWTHKQFVRSMFITGGLLAVIALLWGPIIHLWPRASNISVGPWAWLLLITAAVGAISWLEIAAREKRRANIPLKELRHEIDQLKEQVSTATKNQGESNATLSGMIGRVEDQAEKIALNVQADVKGLQESIRQLGERVESTYQLTGQGQLRIAQSLRARDALEMIRQNDAKVLDLSRRLLSASEYEADQSWLADYNKWKDALGAIDTVLSYWQKEHQPFLGVRASEIERVRDLPPTNLDRERITTQFKTLCLVNERYQDARSGVINYFAMKAADI